MALTQDQLQSARKRVEQELDETLNEIREIDAQVRSFGDNQELNAGADQHIGDTSDVVYEQERLLTIRGQLTERRLQIERVLEKMDRGEYGYCENCGQPIAPERLEALPFATLCIRCQEEQDRRRNGRP